MKSLRFGYTEYWTEFIVPRDSEIQTLRGPRGEDLGVSGWRTSTSGFWSPRACSPLWAITPGEGLEAGGHTGVVRAIYNGEADFGTVFFSPTIDADSNPIWDGDPAERRRPTDAVHRV